MNGDDAGGMFHCLALHYFTSHSVVYGGDPQSTAAGTSLEYQMDVWNPHIHNFRTRLFIATSVTARLCNGPIQFYLYPVATTVSNTISWAQ